jgi:hypothetical protein
MLYIAFRFQFKFAVGAVVALVHDVLITLGFFSVLGMEFDLTVLAALLAVIGYSLNDTIVVSDRIRENFRKIRRAEPIEEINISLTETLGRTLVTSLTTLLVLAALALFGGEIIHGFAIALIVGVGKFKNKSIDKLNGPPKDARRFYELLTGKNGYGFPEQNVCMLLDEEATVDQFKKMFDQALVKRVQDEKDVAVVFFSSHGSRTSDRNGDERGSQHDQTLLFYDSRSDGKYDLVDLVCRPLQPDTAGG